MGPFVAIVMTYFVVLFAAVIGLEFPIGGWSIFALLAVLGCLAGAWFMSSRIEKRAEGPEIDEDGSRPAHFADDEIESELAARPPQPPRPSPGAHSHPPAP